MEISDVELCKVNIVSDGITSKVTVDGIDMSKASAITYRHIAGSCPVVNIELPVDEVTISSPARLEKNDGHATPMT